MDLRTYAIISWPVFARHYCDAAGLGLVSEGGSHEYECEPLGVAANQTLDSVVPARLVAIVMAPTIVATPAVVATPAIVASYQ